MITHNLKDQPNEPVIPEIPEGVSISFSFDDVNIKGFNDELSSLYSESLNSSLYDQCTEIEPLEEITQLIHLERKKQMFIPEAIKDITEVFCDELLNQYNEKVNREMAYTVSTKGNTITHKFMKTPSISFDNEKDKLMNETNIKNSEKKPKKTRREIATEVSLYSRNKTDLKATFTDDHLLTNVN